MPLLCHLSYIHLPTPTVKEQEHRVLPPHHQLRICPFFSSVCEIAFLINCPVLVPCEVNIPVPKVSVCLRQWRTRTLWVLLEPGWPCVKLHIVGRAGDLGSHVPGHETVLPPSMLLICTGCLACKQLMAMDTNQTRLSSAWPLEKHLYEPL